MNERNNIFISYSKARGIEMEYMFQTGGKKMKFKIMNTFAVFVMVLGIVIMTAINVSAASACPDYNGWSGKLSSDKVVVLEEINGNIVTYSLKSSVVPATTSTIPGFKALCIRPDNGFLGIEAEINPIASNWEEKIKDDFVAFSAKGGNGKNLPFDNIAHEIGEVNYVGHGGLPTKEEFLIHVISASICGGYEGNGEEKTCFVKPSKPNIPVPELTSIVLISAGIFGLFMVSRIYSKK
jgi:hypothetical protein